MKNLVSILDVEDDIGNILDLALELKNNLKSDEPKRMLKGKVLGMIFEKPSLRTRVSFEVGMQHLGGSAIYLSPNEVQLGKRESVHDVAKVISRYVDIIMYRAFSSDVMRELAEHADVPVINGLDDLEHPCQVLADLLTIKEHKQSLKGHKLVYLGDGNNVCNSLLLGCASVGMNMVACCPEGYEPNGSILEKAKTIADKNGCNLNVTTDPMNAAVGADVIYTDTWVSMGDETDKEKRDRAFQPYQVNKNLVALAKENHIFLHCLPAHRGQEVTDEVIDSKNSVVFDQAENRMHVQMAIMVHLLD